MVLNSIFSNYKKNEMVVVSMQDGQVKGMEGVDLKGGTFYAFQGIPYGKPPIGELRFKAPEPAVPWTGIKDATKDGNKCIQYSIATDEFVGSEDCLYLNIYTKNLPPEDDKLKPVMVFIHGGVFLYGSNSRILFGPEFLLTEDIVLVVLNYRLGFLGFLHFNDVSLDVPGNAALKDQRLALQWVQKNIKYFNGDSDNVTIFGNSAGSTSVHYHVLSPSSAGLFHKAAIHSGAILNPWTIAGDHALEFVQSIDPNIKTEKEALRFLRDLPVKKLLEYQEKFYYAKGAYYNVIAPNIEQPNPTAIMAEHPVELLLSGRFNKVPMLIGYCDREGLIFDVHIEKSKAAGKPIHERFDYSALHKMIYMEMSLEEGSPIRALIVDKYKEFYFKGDNAADRTLLPGDFNFIPGIIASAKHHAKYSSDVYLFRISIETKLNLSKIASKATTKGVCHGDDVNYLFNRTLTPIQIDEEEIQGIERFVKLWTNFARTGNPTPLGNDLNLEWKPVKKNKTYFLDIGKELILDTDPEKGRIEFWKEIFQLSPFTAQYL